MINGLPLKAEKSAKSTSLWTDDMSIMQCHTKLHHQLNKWIQQNSQTVTKMIIMVIMMICKISFYIFTFTFV